MSVRDLSPAVFRGEVNGTLRERGGWLRPYFFAEQASLATSYARGTQPLCCVLQGQSMLDLTEPNPMNPVHRDVVQRLEARFDEWTCRLSGEHRDAWSYLEGGDLYHYEGTGEATRWNALFQVVLDEMGFDAVRVDDWSDTVTDLPSTVWVTLHRDNIRMATPFEEISSRLRLVTLGDQTQQDLTRWIERNHPILVQRIRRLTTAHDRLSAVDTWSSNPTNHRTIRRVNPSENTLLAPGDLVEFCDQARSPDTVDDLHKVLRGVDLEDLIEDGYGRLMFLPRAWRSSESSDLAEYLLGLDQQRLQCLIEGENASILRHWQYIEAISAHIMEHAFRPAHTGYFHGPDHWARVSRNGRSVARSLGLDPLVPHIFGLVHDSQRQDEGLDPGHGPRAAQFIEANRNTLFAFLTNHQVEDLAGACEMHSNGVTDGPATQQACWDADRLDLFRVGIQPDPRLLCTAYAKRPSTIRSAFAHLQSDRHAQSETEEDFEWDHHAGHRMRA